MKSKSIKLLCFLCVLLINLACQKEEEQFTSPLEQEPVNISASPGLYVEQPEVYEEIGIAFRASMNAYHHHLKKGTLAIAPDMASEELNNDPSLDLKETLKYLPDGLVSENDYTSIEAFGVFMNNLNVSGNTPLVEIREQIDRWIVDNHLNVGDQPISYHSIHIIKEALFKNQLTLALEQPKSQNISFRGANDGTLCTVSGFLCSKSNSFVSNAAKNALSTGAGAIIKTKTEWGTWEISAASLAIKLILDTFWDNIFCNEDCDDCGPAVGVNAIFDGCRFLGIEAVGSFEHAERFIFHVDEQEDGAFEQTITRIGDNFVPASSLPSSGTFDVFVDVECDGRTEMYWPLGRYGVTVNVSRGFAGYPVGSVRQPPLNSGFYYRPNTQLCFGFNSLSLNGWTFERWEASGNASPRTGTSRNSFCTRFSQSFPSTQGVRAIFSNPCSTSDYSIAASGFVVCPSSHCN